jgi:hypothetical protein
VTDLKNRVVRRTRGQEDCPIWFELPRSEHRLVAAVWEYPNLVLLSIDRSNSLSLVWVDTLGIVARRRPVKTDKGITAEPEWLYLSRTDLGVVVGTHQFPAWWQLMSRAAKAPVLVRSPGISRTSLTALDFSADLKDIYASPLLRVGDTYLQTLTDLTTQRRSLLTFDSRGDLLRMTPQKALGGLVASAPGDSIVLAIHREKSSTLVLYSRAHLPH